MSTVQIPRWNLKMDYVETCNCDYGCPCNFNGFPTSGFCRALYYFISRIVVMAMYGSMEYRRNLGIITA